MGILNFMTINQLKELRQNNRTNLVVYKLLSTIIGECEQISKEPSENQIMTIIQKMYKDNMTTLNVLDESRISQIKELQCENDFLKIFIPQQLTHDELFAIINSRINSGDNMGKVMKYLSENYKGRYDGKIASSIVNDLINPKN